MQTFVEADVREQFKTLAEAAGISTNELLRHLVEHAVTKGTDPEVNAAIKAEQKRAEEARNSVLRRIVSNDLTPK